LTGGGFQAFWYQLGYVSCLRELHGPLSWPCSGTSSGSLVAWVLAHEGVTKDGLQQLARTLLANVPVLQSLDMWTTMFMASVSETYGDFRSVLYRGAYVTSPNNRRPQLLRTSNICRDIRASCFIPILSGALTSSDGWWDGALGYAPILPPETRNVRVPSLCTPVNFLPLTQHFDQYDRGFRDAARMVARGDFEEHKCGL
jgi:predicted acylesterase/phospholipase RssA